jgi:riboflavin synthase
MFSGIIEEMGHIQAITPLQRGFRFTIRASKVLNKTKLGDSIAVEGICLTVTKKNWWTFSVDVIQETINRTSLTDWKVGTKVNLERALRMGDRNGGHNVSGHIDGVGTVLSHQPEGIATRFTVSVPQTLTNYMIEKGSVAIDGISLTLTNVMRDRFEVWIIPHTQLHTTLMHKVAGKKVNIEVDMIGKYIEKWIKPNHE